METRHSDTKITTKILLLHNRNSIFAREDSFLWKTHSLMESMVMGIYESKFVILKHFRCDVSAKESSPPFLFTIYTLISVFCEDNSVEYAFDRCVEF